MIIEWTFARKGPCGQYYLIKPDMMQYIRKRVKIDTLKMSQNDGQFVHEVLFTAALFTDPTFVTFVYAYAKLR